ncbi:MAG: NADH-quinone oxidoreductase subunit NuoF [Chitinispirillaceae bacterium]|nr:NADH-quinone oxidoreductase subunit NuoF [Chitinispirillaceae bacterium]
MTITTEKDLDRVAVAGESTLYPKTMKIMIGSASCGIGAGARTVEEAAIKTVKELGIDAVVTRTGCVGWCQREPLVDILVPGAPRLCYELMTPAKMEKVLTEYAEKGVLPTDGVLYRYEKEENVLQDTAFVYPQPNGYAQLPERSTLDFFSRQKRVILRNCGSIDAMNIAEAIARGAYRGAFRALTTMKPSEVFEVVLASGLRGRGGAGFPTARKWETAMRQESDVKYIICNADEGDPGAFMDRSVLEGDPHALVEGLLIGAYAIGASRAFIYVRSEYPLAVETLQQALKEAAEHGITGDNIFGSGFSLAIEIRKGAGAFVCGEETALLASIEGRAGEPRPRPPFPAVKGLWGKPTVINNVKTLSSIGPILSRGAEWYASRGAENNRGTTVFAIVGAVKNTGLVEVPLGISLREMVEVIGGGSQSSRPIKAVQTGGPSGGCIPESLFDLPIDYEKLAGAGAMMGSGGMIAIDTATCIVDLARFFLTFTTEESCGKCTPCREGTKQMLHLLEKICEGKGTETDLAILEDLAATIKSASLCGLGQTAPNPVLTALRHFRSEFEAHVVDKKCPAGVCRNLITVAIDAQRCSGCGQCVKVCAVNAISGERKKAHMIDAGVCTRCGACRNICTFEAVISN